MAAKDMPATSKLETKKFTWRIESFSKREETKLSSDPFSVGGHRWMIDVYPKGNGVDALSVYLRFADSEEMEDGWSVRAGYTLTVVDQINASSSVKLTRNGREFKKGAETSGLKRFVWMADLRDTRKGLLVKDTLIIEAEVSTEAAANDEPKVMEAVQVSLTDPLPQDNSEVTRNLIARLSSMTASHCHGNSSSKSEHVSDMLQEQKEKLIGFFGMSLEAICQTDSSSLDEVESIAINIAEHATDPIEKVVLKDMLSRLAKFKEIVPSSLSAIETSNGVESSVIRITKDIEARLVHRKTQLNSLEAEVSRLGEEDRKLEAEIQQLTARRAKLVDLRNSTVVELDKTAQEASKEVEELEKQYVESERAMEIRLIAKDRLARSNASWKLFKENLGW